MSIDSDQSIKLIVEVPSLNTTKSIIYPSKEYEYTISDCGQRISTVPCKPKKDEKKEVEKLKNEKNNLKKSEIKKNETEKNQKELLNKMKVDLDLKKQTKTETLCGS